MSCRLQTLQTTAVGSSAKELCNVAAVKAIKHSRFGKQRHGIPQHHSVASKGTAGAR